ncbi:MAG: outer membrane protein assembly factor BamB [Burkholderiaceae bacterium]|jgi:outer membrane assembly lipoprotein YfgL|nr:outer membrane protein assembly factor BamB [Burkholderiaceae bacterium]
MADQLNFRPRGVARWMALGLLAGALGGCSTVSSWFSSDTKPKVLDLGPNPGLISVHQAWTAKLGAQVSQATDVLVQGDALIIASKDGAVTALDARTGSQLSRFAVGEPLTAGVGGDAERQAVLTQSNQVMVFAQGKQLWKQPLPASAYTPPLVAGGRVFVLAADRSLTAFDATNGRKLWTAQRPGEPLVLRQPGVLMAVGNTLVAGLSGRMVGLDPDNGSVRWEASLASPRGTNDVERLVDLVGRVSRVGDSVCARAFQASVGCVDTQNASVRWTQPSKGAEGIDGDGDALFGAESNGTVQAWRRGDGSRLWSIDKLQHRKLTAPLLLGRSVVFGDDYGVVHLLSKADGQALARLQTDDSGVASAPVTAANTLVVVSRSGTVYGFRPD